MSNIERKYEYYDQGVLPSEGEYGVTYLTLYSSGSGNIYDGWIYDPDNKTPLSTTERTFGYRNPDYPQYCWDDEVVVDLSNPQNREESDSTQGRITSFNTNVSPYPIIIQDTDVSEMTEDERERHATTILFTAIPLVSDAYIQAMVEVQCKCNLSPDNTSGEMRVEAFYILNDESDRTMRPNPVHTFTVSSRNERHTLPLLYFNPALKHEDHNYIGVKLVVTGGTLEIGISDAKEYGDAMITLVSAGLTGDIIDAGKPVALEIYGLDEVAPGYKLNIDDYNVFCEYDSGEVYEVTRLCTFNPEMGTEIQQPITLLVAEYMGLMASMQIILGQVEYIELSGNTEIHGSYTFDIDDYVVLAYFDNGDVWDVTDQCSFSPSMGTTVSTNTTLVATYEPFWMPGSIFSDSLNLTTVGVSRQSSTNYDLIYTLYDDGYLTIEGGVSDDLTADTSIYENDAQLVLKREVLASSTPNYPNVGINQSKMQANHSFFSVTGTSRRGTTINFSNSSVSDSTNKNCMYYYIVNLTPWSGIKKVEWRATGKPFGICCEYGTKVNNRRRDIEFIKFDKMDTSRIITLAYAFARLSESDLSWLDKKEFPELLDIVGTFSRCDDNTSFKALNSHNIIHMTYAFGLSTYENDIPEYVRDLDVSKAKLADAVFQGASFKNTNGLINWRMPECLAANSMFRSITNLESIAGLINLGFDKNTDYGAMFQGDTSLENIGSCLITWKNNSADGRHTGAGGSNGLMAMFANCSKLKNPYGAGSFISKIPSSDVWLDYMFFGTGLTNLLNFIGAITGKVAGIQYMFDNCRDLESFIGFNGNASNIAYANGLFLQTKIKADQAMDLQNYWSNAQGTFSIVQPSSSVKTCRYTVTPQGGTEIRSDIATG